MNVQYYLGWKESTCLHCKSPNTLKTAPPNCTFHTCAERVSITSSHVQELSTIKQAMGIPVWEVHYNCINTTSLAPCSWFCISTVFFNFKKALDTVSHILQLLLMQFATASLSYWSDFKLSYSEISECGSHWRNGAIYIWTNDHYQWCSSGISAWATILV